MDHKIIERGAKTTDDVLALISGEGRYGIDGLTRKAVFEEPVSKGFQPMMDELRSRLHLLKLTTDAPRVDIYAAYGHDIQLLDEYLNGFEHFLKKAAYASMCGSPEELKERERWDSVSHSWRDPLWDRACKSIPPLVREPIVNFSAEIAAQPVQELLSYLTTEIDSAVTKVFSAVSFWLNTLVTREFVGLLTVTGADAGRYHYFRPLFEEKVLAENKGTRRVAYDKTKPYGQRTTYETKAGKLTAVTHKLERHDHDIVIMQVHTIADYPEKMPDRVVDLLNHTPEFIRRHLRVVSGMIIRERVQTRTVKVEMEDTRHTSTWLASPALLIAGVYVPVGWSGHDMKDSTGFFSGQKAYSSSSNRSKRLTGWVREHLFGTFCILVASLLIGRALLKWFYGL